MKVALDAMGGDLAPREAVLGAVGAVRDDADVHVLLFGREEVVKAELDTIADYPSDRVTIVHANDVVTSDESAREAIRKKRDSSIARGIQAVAKGEAEVFLSAGNTGAVVGAATVGFRLIPGIKKAGIAVTMGTRQRVTVIDVGANIYCKPEHLLHYGIMASTYCERVYGVEAPRVGILNIGSEEAKGNELVKETRELFSSAPFNFIGSVEGNDIFAAKADVVVCEGFVGNVVLKTSEGLSESLHDRFEEIVGAHVNDSSSEFVEVMQEFRAATDYAEAGGAPLLGVNGTCTICHGRSDSRAFRNAIRVAAKYARAGVVDKIRDGIATIQAG